MLAEVMAALGDELSYVQDRYAREAYLETLSQRRSMRWHTRLVDFPIHDGLNAKTLLTVEAETAAFAEAGMRVWAIAGGEEVIPFELGDGIEDQINGMGVWVHHLWNEISAHVPDESNPCLPVGSTEIYLRGDLPLSNQLPEPDPNPEAFWIGREMVLESTPSDPSLPRRRHLIRIYRGGAHRRSVVSRRGRADEDYSDPLA